MEQMQIDPENLISIDFENGPYSKTIRTFRPDVYTEDGTYYALLGPDKATGILGSGAGPDEALLDWDKQLAVFISQKHSPDDPVAEFVFDTLGTSKKDVG
ncbi:hypothetical protein [Dyadobacter sandarakinus]|uniref:Uncharacterized protein n=1 Tax=Dyadobacter sandarakinus TaxID=2747268 RepID=A0ABX7I2H2_9BACT|nr:hypothetical protein [Dyadobacter sandarakinus]QRR00274.1 hypothetical protein HWI92_04825 [Dyadobacter sandarakinus]